MANHTIYVRPENAATFERARQIAEHDGVSLSSIIEQAIRAWVEKQERNAGRKICPKCGTACGYWNLPKVCGK
jgi:hypothetical protein